ncbi:MULTISPECIES: type VI secretion system-associated protein TagF [unclassified Mesorhizobium]|uniref:type VI secretion system-associated protein TagF n=1 Tax=unclassified Mesorhizobium TaxID=325217 RepID=UPI003015547D
MNERHVIDAATEADRIGFFGKVPTHGDFISTGLGRTFQTELDNWIQAGLQASEQAHGKEWQRLFRAAPPWRFVIERSLWGQSTMVGVLLPSTDRVGRSFPLVIAAKLGSFSGNPRLLCFDETWFTAAEALAETSLTRDFDIAGFTAGLKRLRLPHAKLAARGEMPASNGDDRISIWWTVDVDTRRPHGFKTNGPPQAAHFLKLLNGKPIADTPKPEPDAPPDPARKAPIAAVMERVPARKFAVERSYATHPGTRLSVNADALLVSEKPRLFAVADGVGDGNGAADAAKVTTNTLANVSAHETLEELIQDVKGKLGRAHGLLQSAHALSEREAPSASVAALTIRDSAFAIIWAGNARCYLVRDGMMRCLTRDHVEIGLRFALSRSIGSQRQLVPEVFTDTVQDGDRFLLCSAALTRTLDERSIAETLLEKPVEEAAGILIQDGLIANARENISAIVIGIRAA